MNVDQMLAGQELDALVAEKVMGLTKGRSGGFGDDDHEAWFRPSGGKVSDYGPPRYSTDMAEAWAVVEKLKATSSRGYVLDFLRGQWTAGNRACGDAGEPELYGPEAGRAEEAPLAICRAALKAAL